MIRRSDSGRSVAFVRIFAGGRYLKGKCPIETAIADCQMKTRNYAKRQMTWFRPDLSIRWIDEFGWSAEAKEIALGLASAFLRGPD